MNYMSKYSIKSSFLLALKVIIGLGFFVATPIYAETIEVNIPVEHRGAWSFNNDSFPRIVLNNGLVSGDLYFDFVDLSIEISTSTRETYPNSNVSLVVCTSTILRGDYHVCSPDTILASSTNRLVSSFTNYFDNYSRFNFSSVVTSGGDIFIVPYTDLPGGTVDISRGIIGTDDYANYVVQANSQSWESKIRLGLTDTQSTTRILSLDPSAGSTTPSGNDVFFQAKAWIADEPSFWDTISISLVYNDENHILSELTGFYETTLIDTAATTTGLFQYSTTTPLADGNYTVIFTLKNSTIGGLLYNPFGGDTQILRHQFTVGSSTYLGNINQSIITDLNTIFNDKTATSTSVLLGHCLPWVGSGFDITDCLSGLLIPDTSTMHSLVEDFKDQIMRKAPWGYAVRMFAIISGSGTSTPPVLTFTVPSDNFFSSSLQGKTISFDPWHVVSEGSVLDNADGFGSGNLMDTFMPYWKIIVYGLVIFGVIHKLFGMSSGSINTNFGRGPMSGVRGVQANNMRDVMIKNIRHD